MWLVWPGDMASIFHSPMVMFAGWVSQINWWYDINKYTFFWFSSTKPYKVQCIKLECDLMQCSSPWMVAIIVNSWWFVSVYMPLMSIWNSYIPGILLLLLHEKNKTSNYHIGDVFSWLLSESNNWEDSSIGLWSLHNNYEFSSWVRYISHNNWTELRYP